MSTGKLISSEGLDSFHRAFETMLEGVTFKIASEVIAKKLKSRGIPLSQSEIDILAHKLQHGADKQFTFTAQHAKSTQSLELELTAKDADDVEHEVEEFLKKLPDLIAEQSSAMATTTLKRLKKRWRKEYLTQERELNSFRKRLFRRWEPGLAPLAMMLIMCREVGANVCAKTCSSEDDHQRSLIDVITRMHARACQVTDEVVWLLRGGFSEGALARWRTLHEIAVTSALIADGGEDLAKRYVDHQYVESLLGAEEYQRVHEKLGYEPIEDREMRQSKRRADEVIARYGRTFRNPNGWACELLKQDRPTFAQMEAAVSSAKYRSHYRWASHGVHASPKGIFKPDPYIGDLKILLTGPSNGGLADPGHATAISLGRITAHAAALKPTLDLNISMQMILTLIDETGSGFSLCHNTLMQEEAQEELEKSAHAETPSEAGAS